MLDFVFEREVKLYKEVVYGCARQREEDERAVTKVLPKHRRELLSKGYGDEYTAAIVNRATKEVMQELRDRSKVLRAMIAESK